MGLIYTGGTFDLFHAGHVEFLKRCSQYGQVIVSLNTDEFIAEYKGKPPVMNLEERTAVVEACRFVAGTVCNIGGLDSTIAIEEVEPDLIVIGSDWARRNYYGQMGFDQDWLDQRGIGLMYLPYTQGISSTEIKARLAR